MARIKFQQTPGKSRGQGFFPQLSGLGRACSAIASAQTTDRGATGPWSRGVDDAQARIAKQAEKLARRAKRAGF